MIQWKFREHSNSDEDNDGLWRTIEPIIWNDDFDEPVDRFRRTEVGLLVVVEAVVVIIVSIVAIFCILEYEIFNNVAVVVAVTI